MAHFRVASPRLRLSSLESRPSIHCAGGSPPPFPGVGGLDSRVPPSRLSQWRVYCTTARLVPRPHEPKVNGSCSPLPRLLAYLPLLSAEALARNGSKIVVGPWEEAEKLSITTIVGLFCIFFLFLGDYVDCRFRISGSCERPGG